MEVDQPEISLKVAGLQFQSFCFHFIGLLPPFHVDQNTIIKPDLEGSISELGCSIKLLDSKLEKPIGALPRPAHALSLETTTDSQVDMFFHRT